MSITGQLVGYGRVSTTDQKAGLEAQLRDLKAAGCVKVFYEELSAVATKRPELHRVLDYVRDGDTLIVTKPDRLARSTADLLDIAKRLEAKGVTLRILSMNVDTGTPTGKLLLTMLGAIATFERELMLERQREGISRAKAEGRYRGRAPTAQAKSEQVFDLHRAGVGPVEIARRLQIGRSSVYRVLKAVNE
ncbi:recombinase family protein [Aquamicrobium soli]|uniref:Recombinase family protein n=1 Tax=Aquamicrobium soli TaxID=1811518 RepID=A0ABV7KDE5_9HYPH